MASRLLTTVRRSFSATRTVRYESADPDYEPPSKPRTNSKKPLPVNVAKGNKIIRLLYLEKNYRENIIEIIKIRKDLGFKISDQDMAVYRDEEENRDLTESSIRHSRSDPKGEFTQVDFSKQAEENKTPKFLTYDKEMKHLERTLLLLNLKMQQGLPFTDVQIEQLHKIKNNNPHLDHLTTPLVNYSKPKKAMKNKKDKEESEEDRWLTEQAEAHARNA